jgi:thiamine-monophosphate kinase
LLKDLDVQPKAMIDISDGLSSETLHICTQSKVGVELYEDKIPMDPLTVETAREFNLDPTICALSGGEDYELLFTIDLNDYDKVKNSPDITVIGHITDEAAGRNLVTRSGNSVELKAQGWNALLAKD